MLALHSDQGKGLAHWFDQYCSTINDPINLASMPIIQLYLQLSTVYPIMDLSGLLVENISFPSYANSAAAHTLPAGNMTRTGICYSSEMIPTKTNNVYGKNDKYIIQVK